VARAEIILYDRLAAKCVEGLRRSSLWTISDRHWVSRQAQSQRPDEEGKIIHHGVARGIERQTEVCSKGSHELGSTEASKAAKG
jgi:hypothetical protein